MARTNRQSAPPIKDILFQEPYRFEFHQAIKLLEYLYPKAAPFGETVNPLDEVVTVKSRIYLESMASDIYSLDNVQLTSEFPPILNINFMGIAGIQGPLPFPYTEMLIQRIRNGDTSLKDFLDIFNHRLTSILHRIRKQYMISLNTLVPEKTEIAIGLKSFIGIGQDALENRLAVPDRSLLDYAALYWSHPRSAKGLETILRSYFKIPVSVERYVGGWRPLARTEQTRIGRTGQWQRLGQGAVLGTRVWDQMGHFRLHLGPLDVEKLDTFIPCGKGFERLKDLTKLYVGPSMDFSVHYAAKNPPSTTLKDKAYLGWRSWLGTSLLSGDDVEVEGTASFSG
ncbi:MAG: type VI secretion system baseplate subunit TssG [Alphaproteobacteria bacterium]|nr:type VI secretion system baseplate subunit TssG [Alphaproteobacteria bacterium]